MLQPLRGLVGERSIAVVDVHDVVGGTVIRDIDVRPAVSVDIRYHDAESVAGIPQYAGFSGHVCEFARFPSDALVPIELVKAAGCRASQTRGVAHDAPREILGRVVEHKEVEASVPVVIQENRVGGEASIRDAVLSGGLADSAVLVVDEEEI